MTAFRCLHCGTPLGAKRTQRALYCGPRCRSGLVNLTRRHFQHAAPSIENLFQLLREHAPQPASAYQLILDDGRNIYRYPPSDRAWLATDGILRYRSAYRLYPFEIPIVPMSAIYAVQLVTRFYRLPTPEALLQGVRLDPVRPCLVDEGERIA